MFIPDAFSPNNDGKNDIFYVYGKGIKKIEFCIFDRLGEKVFSSDDIKQGWDGTYKGTKLSKAVFVYYVKVEFYSGNLIEKKGNVTLIK